MSIELPRSVESQCGPQLVHLRPVYLEMSPLDGSRYQKLRLRQAQRLASRVFAQTVDSRAPKGAHNAELVK